MIYRVMSIYDSGVSVFGTPFHVNHVQHGIRYFQTLARHEKSDVSRFPSQFTLFELGEFDDQNGVITMHSAPVSLGLASSFQEV